MYRRRILYTLRNCYVYNTYIVKSILVKYIVQFPNNDNNSNNTSNNNNNNVWNVMAIDSFSIF